MIRCGTPVQSRWYCPQQRQWFETFWRNCFGWHVFLPCWPEKASARVSWIWGNTRVAFLHNLNLGMSLMWQGNLNFRVSWILRNYTCCLLVQLTAAARGNNLQSEGATALAVSLSCLSSLGALLLGYVHLPDIPSSKNTFFLVAVGPRVQFC